MAVIETYMDSGYAPGTALCRTCRVDLDPGPTAIGTAEYFYMVTDELWRSVGMGRPRSARDLLCVGCLEARLGRQLVAEDFKPGSAVNWTFARDTPRLAARKALIEREPGSTFLRDWAVEIAALAGRSGGSVPAVGARPAPMVRRAPAKPKRKRR